MLLLFEINLFGIAVLNNNQIDNFQGKCFVTTAIFFLSRFMHIYETIFVNSITEQESKKYESHLCTLGDNASLQLNMFMFLVNLVLRV